MSGAAVDQGTNVEQLWAGNIYGTNTGNVFVEFVQKLGSSDLKGTLRIDDHRYGLCTYLIAGVFDGSVLSMMGEPFQIPEGAVGSPLSAKLTLSQEGVMTGTWASNAGAGGTVVLHPHSTAQPTQANISRLYNQKRELGTIRPTLKELRRVIATMQEETNNTAVVVSYGADHRMETVLSQHFLDDDLKPNVLGKVILQARTSQPNTLQRVIMVELDADGVNQVRAEGPDQVWVNGVVEAIHSPLKATESRLLTWIRRHGLIINQLLFLAALVWLPEVETWESRAVVLALIIGAMVTIAQLHKRLIPNTKVMLGQKDTTGWSRLLPDLGFAGISALVAGIFSFAYSQFGEKLTAAFSALIEAFK